MLPSHCTGCARVLHSHCTDNALVTQATIALHWHWCLNNLSLQLALHTQQTVALHSPALAILHWHLDITSLIITNIWYNMENLVVPFFQFLSLSFRSQYNKLITTNWIGYNDCHFQNSNAQAKRWYNLYRVWQSSNV